MPTRMTFVGADDAGPSGGADEDNSGNAGESESEQPRQFVAGPPQAQASQAGGQPRRRLLLEVHIISKLYYMYIYIYRYMYSIISLFII